MSARGLIELSTISNGCTNTVLFAWRWPTEGLHTLQIQPGIANAKEGGSFIDISSYLVTP